MYIYFNKQGELTTTIEHGQPVRQGSYLDIFVCLDEDFFDRATENVNVSISLIIPNGGAMGRDTVYPTQHITYNSENSPNDPVKFEKTDDSEATYDLIDGNYYWTYHFRFSPTESTIYDGTLTANVKISKWDIVNELKTMQYQGNVYIYIEKTYGNAVVKDKTPPEYYEAVVGEVDRLNGIKLNRFGDTSTNQKLHGNIEINGKVEMIVEDDSEIDLTRARETHLGDVDINGKVDITASEDSELDLRNAEVLVQTTDNENSVVTKKYVDGHDLFEKGDGEWSVVQKVETDKSTASGENAVALGNRNISSGKDAFSFGVNNTASGDNSFAEGNSTISSGINSHSEGTGTEATGSGSHAEGMDTTASGSYSHTEGSDTEAEGNYSHAEGIGTIARENGQHVEGKYNADDSDAIHIVGNGTSDADRKNAFTVNVNGTATIQTEPIDDMNVANKKYVDDRDLFERSTGENSIKVKDTNSVASGRNTVVFGTGNTASGEGALSEGKNNEAIGKWSHAEGISVDAKGDYSHAEGYFTTVEASAMGGHAEGSYARSSAYFAHAEGAHTTAYGYASHAEGYENSAGGKYSHSEGHSCGALGESSHAEGTGTMALEPNQHVEGSYNANDTNAIHIVGNGTSTSDRRNAFTVNKNGTATVQTNPINNMDVATKSYVEGAISNKADLVDGKLSESQLPSSVATKSFVENITDTKADLVDGKLSENQLPTNVATKSFVEGAISNKADLVDGKVPASQLPSYVDDVLEFDTYNDFPTTPEEGKIYIAKNTNKTYRWSGSQYVEITSSIALGTTAETAYAGNKGVELENNLEQLATLINSYITTLPDAVVMLEGEQNVSGTKTFYDGINTSRISSEGTELYFDAPDMTFHAGMLILGGETVSFLGSFNISFVGAADESILNSSADIVDPFYTPPNTSMITHFHTPLIGEPIINFTRISSDIITGSIGKYIKDPNAGHVGIGTIDFSPNNFPDNYNIILLSYAGIRETLFFDENAEIIVGDTYGGGKSDREKYHINLPSKSGTLATLDDIPESSGAVSIQSITWAELKALRDNGQLVPGQSYRITDYVATVRQNAGVSVNGNGHPFDIIVIADTENVLNENARACLHEGDTYFAEQKLESWEIKYCIDNDNDRFDWANSSSGKGVIYFLKDNYNNEAPFDFKNIQIYSSVMGGGDYYLFSGPSSYIDASVAPQSSRRVYNNKICEVGDSTLRKMYIPNVKFLLSKLTVDCYNNLIEWGPSKNNGSVIEIMSTSIDNVIIKSGCKSIRFIGNYNDSSISKIEIGHNCKSIVIRTNASNITIGNGCEYINIDKRYTSNITIENGCKYITLDDNNGTASNTNLLRNIKVCQNLVGASSTNPLVLSVDRNNDFVTEFKSKNYTEVILDD